MRRTNAGFTIVELMGVLMILGVLSALVLPTIRVNKVRVKMSEVLIQLSSCRNMISEVYQSAADPPPGGEWGCEVTSGASTYVDSISTDGFGKVTASLRGFNDGRLDTHDVTLMPLDNTGNPPAGTGSVVRRWRCGSIIDGTSEYVIPYLPSSCRG